MSASGLTSIHSTSATGNDASAVGCAQYDEIPRVAAQPNDASPAGTSAW